MSLVLPRSGLWFWLDEANFQPIRSTIWIWVVMHHRYGICTFVPQTSFFWETGVTREMLAIRGLLFLLKMYQRPPSQLLCHLSASILGIGTGKKKAAGGKKQVTKRWNGKGTGKFERKIFDQYGAHRKTRCHKCQLCKHDWRTQEEYFPERFTSPRKDFAWQLLVHGAC